MIFSWISDFLSWKSAFFMLLSFMVLLHVGSSAAILQLVAGLEAKEGKTIPTPNRWKLITILPFAALYYSVVNFCQRRKK